MCIKVVFERDSPQTYRCAYSKPGLYASLCTKSIRQARNSCNISRLFPAMLQAAARKCYNMPGFKAKWFTPHQGRVRGVSQRSTITQGLRHKITKRL